MAAAPADGSTEQMAISNWQLAGRRCAFSYRFTSCASFCKKVEAGFSWANCYLLFMLAVIWHKKAGASLPAPAILHAYFGQPASPGKHVGEGPPPSAIAVVVDTPAARLLSGLS